MSNKLEELKKKEKDKLPQHIGLILDGNRRWARKHGVDINTGHYKGYEAVKKILYGFLDAGVKYITIYALSLENALKRTATELKHIYKILMTAVDTVLNEPIVKDEKVNFKVIGRIEQLPSDVRDKIDELLEATKDHDQNFVNVCIMYDGQEEIVDAVKDIIKEGIKPDEIDKVQIKKHLYTKYFPEVDYIIRTGMEDGARISGFLVWDASYAEFKFRKDYWPDYDEEMLYEDLIDYLGRKRRKGK